MLAADLPAALGQPADDGMVKAQIVQADSHSRDVHNRVHRADLMKMYLIYRLLMNIGLCLGQYVKNAQRQGFGAGSHAAPADDGGNVF